MTVSEQKEGSEVKREKEDELNRENIYTETDAIEDVSDKDNNAGSTVYRWRDSGYITSDCEDSIMKQFGEIGDKNQERIASIFWF